jgi:hypothetical protein
VGVYFVSCAATEPCPKGSSTAHVTQIGLRGSDGAEVIGLSVARLMISSGDTLTVGERGDDDAELRKGRCDACGARTLRMSRGSGFDVAAMPRCD